MKDRFENEDSWKVWNGERSKTTQRLVPANLHEKAAAAMDFVLALASPNDASVKPGFKRLHGDAKDFFQFKIGSAHRVRFSWSEGKAVRIHCGEFHDDD